MLVPPPAPDEIELVRGPWAGYRLSELGHHETDVCEGVQTGYFHDLGQQLHDRTRPLGGLLVG